MRHTIVTALTAAALATGGAAAWADPGDREAGKSAQSEATESGAPEPGEARSERGSMGESAPSDRPGKRGDTAATPGSTERERPEKGEYVVREGDTLAKLAERFMGSAEEWQVLAKRNGIDDPRKLRVGQRLRIPETTRQGS